VLTTYASFELPRNMHFVTCSIRICFEGLAQSDVIILPNRVTWFVFEMVGGFFMWFWKCCWRKIYM